LTLQYELPSIFLWLCRFMAVLFKTRSCFSRHSLFVLCMIALVFVGLAAHAAEVTHGNEIDQPKQKSEKPPAPKFSIWEYRIKGSTLLDTKDIELTLYPYLGKNKTIEDVYSAVDALKALYRKSGYPAVDVVPPPQDVNQGIVRLDVVEGKVSRLRVSGSRYFSLREIKALVPSVQKGQSVHISSFQQDINKLNRKTSNLRVTPIFKQGRSPGTIEVDLRVRDKFPLNSNLELNNFSTRNTTDTRLSLSLGYDNLWLKNHNWSLQTQTTPEDTNEVRVLATTYVLPVFDDAAKLALYAVKSDSEIAAVGDSVVIGNGNIFGVRYVLPLVSTRSYLHSVSTGVDYKDFNETISVLGSDGGLSRPIAYGSFTGLYNATMLSPGVTSSLGVGVSFGIRNFPGADGQLAFTQKRFRAKSNFIHVQAKLKSEKRFSNDWLLAGKTKIQVADSSLISNEQFSAGGHESVRAYYESEQVGDEGVTASVQLSGPSLHKRLPKTVNQLRLHAFVDGAYLRVKDEIKTDASGNNFFGDKEYGLASTGLGLTLRALRKKLALETYAGVALRESADIDQGDVKVHASLKYEF